MFYIGTSVDLFISTKAIAIKSIISKKVAPQDLGKIFSVLGILESLNGFIFPSLYSFVYLKTVDSFVGAIYFLSEGFFLLTLIMFIIIFFMTRNDPKKVEENPENMEISKL
jgi:MFS transporter, PCFT/HCP family, solute carrier family 46, member 3